MLLELVSPSLFVTMLNFKPRLLNALAVRAYGEAEFWLSSGKVILIFILFAFTFVTMVGGNPAHDAYGFRYWSSPGAFATHVTKGGWGRLEGFMGALESAAFCVCGPDYISIVAAEAKHPSVYVKTAFKTVYFRFGLFFVGTALAVGIVLPYNDQTLYDIYLGGTGSGSGTAAASPFVIAMENLGIDVLPHIVNALMFTTIYSAGNTYTYCATRSLYGLALENRAPAFLRKCNSRGVPIYCFAVVMLFPLLSFLQLNSGSSQVLNWLLALITGGGVIGYIIMSITYIFFYRACMAQGIDRRKFPYVGYFQPYGAWIALVLQTIVLMTYGYSAFKPWSVSKFFANYTMQFVAPLLFIGWKLFKRTKFVKPEEADIIWDRPVIEAYEASLTEPPVSFWREMVQLIGLGKKKNEAPVAGSEKS